MFYQNSYRSGIAGSLTFGGENSQSGVKPLHYWDSVREVYVRRFPDSELVGIEAAMNTIPMIMSKRSEPEILTIIAQSKRSSQNDGISTPKIIPERISSGPVPTKYLASTGPTGRYDSFSFCKETPDSGPELQSWDEKNFSKQMNQPGISKYGTDFLQMSPVSLLTLNNQKFTDSLVKGRGLPIQELEARNLKNEARILQLTQQINTQQIKTRILESPNTLSQNTIWEKSQTLEYSMKSSGIDSTIRSARQTNRQRPSPESRRIAHLLSSNNSALPRSDTSRPPLSPMTPPMISFSPEPTCGRVSTGFECRSLVQDLPMGTGQSDTQLRTDERMKSDIGHISEIRTTKKRIKTSCPGHLSKLDLKNLITDPEISPKTPPPLRGP
jgi:hypothetical protein